MLNLVNAIKQWLLHLFGIDKQLEDMSTDLTASTDRLAAAVKQSSSKGLAASTAPSDQGVDIMADTTQLDNLKAAVARDVQVESSAVTLITGLKSALDSAIASGDPAQLQALSDSLGASTDALAAAITANTPAAPAP